MRWDKGRQEPQQGISIISIMRPMTDSLGGTLGLTQTPADKAQTRTREDRIILLMEADRPLAASMRLSLAGVHEVSIGRGSPRVAERAGAAPSTRLSLRVPDRWMSSRHARLTCSFGRWILEDQGSKNGSQINGAPTQRAELRDGDLFELGHTFFLFRRAVEPAPGDPLDIDAAAGTVVGAAQAGNNDNGGDKPASHIAGLLTFNAPLAHDLARIRQLAATPVSLLLLGDSGTGKEVLANAIHTLSQRPGAFIAVNCGAIPETLVESELFGHKKGAFSGAVSDHTGLVRSAHEGTLFLDEIADLPPPSQAALLRVLQEREVRPVGAAKASPVDIRLVSATHKDLDALVAQGAFRRDLYARIAGFRVALPPLAARSEDIGILIAHLLGKVATDPKGVSFDIDAARAVLRYPWPLNIRELENCLLAASALAAGSPIDFAHLPAELRSAATGGPSPIDPAHAPRPGHTPAPLIAKATPAPSVPPQLTPEQERHREHVEALLREHRGNISAIARTIGKDRKQIQRWIKRYGLDAESYRGQ